MRFVNLGKYAASRLHGRARYRQSLVAYSFLLDYLPGWNEAYRPGGFIQYQLFVPRDAAEAAFEKALRLQHEMGVVSSLAVVKRHRADRFATRLRPRRLLARAGLPGHEEKREPAHRALPRVRRASPRVRRAHLQGEGLRRKRRAAGRGAWSGVKRAARGLFCRGRPRRRPPARRLPPGHRRRRRRRPAFRSRASTRASSRTRAASRRPRTSRSFRRAARSSRSSRASAVCRARSRAGRSSSRSASAGFPLRRLGERQRDVDVRPAASRGTTAGRRPGTGTTCCGNVSGTFTLTRR